ncbi:hypothetical protein [Aquimarina longa]|uniref:hypothetical protein n=1 Tax=Aquimarina longa TaxID=1080221 RepID=UPI0007862914|nr:hypothetical protein [Aquimarina longa]
MKYIYSILLLLSAIVFSCKQTNKNQKETSFKNNNNSVVERAKIKSNHPPFKIKNISINDGFWKREAYYKSKIEGEKYYQVRVSIIDTLKSFYFLGLRKRKFDEDTVSISKVYLYELDKNKNIFIVDSLPVTKSGGNYYYEDLFLSRQYDNLILKKDCLFYYKENQNLLQDTTDNYSFRNYFKYKLGSKEQPIKIEKNQLPFKEDKISIGLYDVKATIDSKKSIVALTNSSNIFILKNKLWQDNIHALDTINPYRFSESYKNSINIQLSTYPQFEYHDSTEPCPLNAMFGSMSWDDRGKVLYFDNSAICQACIWKIDIKTKELIKIVPEHEAIDPYFFKEKGKENIAYVYKNCIQLAHPIKKKSNRISKNIITYNPKNYRLDYDENNLFIETKILDKKSDKSLVLKEGDFYLGSEDSGISFYFSIDKNNKLSGTYKFYRNDNTSEDNILFHQMNIIDSKIVNQIIGDNEYNYYYEYDHENKKCHTQQYTKNKQFVSESFSDWDKLEEYFISEKTRRYNSENKTYLETYYYSGIVIEYDSVFNLKSKKDPNNGFHKFYKNNYLNRIELIGDEWGIKEFEKDKFEIFIKNKGKQVLEKNMDYIFKISINSYYQFSTDNNGFIISKTFKYVCKNC